MSVSFSGFNNNTLTFKCSVAIDKGTPVMIYKSSTVIECNDGESFHGIVVDSDSKYASVQVRGVVKMPYTGTAPATGYNSLGADGNGGVKLSTSSVKYLILDVDETENIVTFLM
ncbi:MAG: hypothetical protein IJZ07_08050 [Clostridia bacterium]|nr:hypothetical protein [Clostridia bacterium]